MIPARDGVVGRSLGLFREEVRLHSFPIEFGRFWGTVMAQFGSFWELASSNCFLGSVIEPMLRSLPHLRD